MRVLSALLLACAAALVQAAHHHHHHHADPDAQLAAANAPYAALHGQIGEAVRQPQQDIRDALGADGYTPSATPLLLLSPEVSVWSFATSLATPTFHWSGQSMGLVGALRVDGVPFAFLGNNSALSDAQALVQVSSVVMPTSTFYLFSTPAGAQAGVSLSVLFTSVVDDLGDEEELSRPYAYVTFSVNNTDAHAAHAVELYFDLHADWVLDQQVDNSQNVAWTDHTAEDASSWVAHSLRNYDETFFSVKGDYRKMNWGAALMAAPADSRLAHTLAEAAVARAAFARGGAAALPPLDADGVRAFNDRPVASVFAWRFGALQPGASTGAFAVIGYDDIFSMQYFGDWQIPLWRHTWNNDVRAMLLDGIASFPGLLQRTLAFDAQLWSQLMGAGNASYAVLTSLAYRQVTGGIKGVWSRELNESRWYMKEISSDGDISTVDVIFPASPFFLHFGPNILQKMMLPLFQYALNQTDIHYNLPWAPHHLGFWPVCDITAGQQEQMPMEESGNFLLMLAGMAQVQKGDVRWLQPYWGLLQTWADYIIHALPDPGDQLCTDDFEGPSPHNVNLALKGVLGLGAYAQLLQANAQPDEAKSILQQAQAFAAQWIALGADKGHSRLQYNEPGTWSMKYNMLFHYILDMSLFPASVMAEEISFYKTVMAPWGLPLDSRGPLTKTDWTSWIAAMSSDAAYAAELFDLLVRFVMQSPSRGVPFSDWYATDDGHVLGFRARPVQGGLFAKLLLVNQQQQQQQQQAGVAEL